MNQHVKETLTNLEAAAESLSKYLEGKNKRGLVTNILNAAYDIKKYYAEKESELNLDQDN